MRLTSTFALALAVAAVLMPGATTAQAADASHTHIRHALEAFGSTPDGRGLLPVAEAEAATAQRHAGLAGSDPTNIDPMKRHARHVLHAVDPEQFPQGPGLGFGVKAAADGIVRHIGLAAAADGASSNVGTHAAHVVAAASAVSERADRIVELVGRILSEGDYVRASGLVGELQTLCEALVSGADASGDGSISLDEGGLQHVRQHLELMADGEGLTLR